MKHLVLLVVALILVGVTAANADTIVGTTAPIPGSDNLNIAQLGSHNPALGSPITLTTLFGNTVTASLTGASADFGVYTEFGPSCGNLGGSLAPCAAVLSTELSNGPITLSFANPVNAFWLQIDQGQGAGPVGTPYTAEMKGYDASNTLLFDFTAVGHTGSGPDTAPYLGAIDQTGANIAKFDVSVSPSPGFGFYIAQPVQPVPEPSSLLLLVTSLLTLAGGLYSKLHS